MKSDTEDVRRRKVAVFWNLYGIDKTLSLRLGRASTLQDYHIDLPQPEFGDDELSQRYTKLIRYWIASARVQGLVYEQLYSPGALKQEETLRVQKARVLIQDLVSLRARDCGVCNPILFHHERKLT
jgi:hypothetical protein